MLAKVQAVKRKVSESSKAENLTRTGQEVFETFFSASWVSLLTPLVIVALILLAIAIIAISSH